MSLRPRGRQELVGVSWRRREDAGWRITTGGDTGLESRYSGTSISELGRVEGAPTRPPLSGRAGLLFLPPPTPNDAPGDAAADWLPERSRNDPRCRQTADVGTKKGVKE